MVIFNINVIQDIIITLVCKELKVLTEDLVLCKKFDYLLVIQKSVNIPKYWCNFYN